MSDDVVVAEMSDDISVIIRTADQTRKAEVTVSSDNSCGELIAGAIENWSLDNSVDYTISNVTQNISLDPDATVGKSGIQDGDMLEVQPVLVAGYVSA